MELIGLLCMCKIIITMLFISIFFGVEHIPKEIKPFINNNNNNNNNKTLKQIFLEYKHIIP